MVLNALLDAHPDLRHEAERAAVSLMTDIDSGTVAAAVIETYLSQSYMDITDRAGRRPDRGYVHEADAQWELLEEALEPNLEEIARVTRLGFERAAAEHAYAVLAGIRLRSRSAMAAPPSPQGRTVAGTGWPLWCNCGAAPQSNEVGPENPLGFKGSSSGVVCW